MNSDFHTLKGYELLENKQLTYAMEDYLEMICRICANQKFVRVYELSEKLNVRPSSINKMVNNLKALSLVDFEKYGYIKSTETGKKLGDYFIHRHEVLHDFLCYINHSDNELEQVEKIEHFLNRETIKNIEIFMKNLDKKNT